MRILYLNPTGTLGGAERVLLCILGAVRRERPEAELHLVTCADGPLPRRAKELGVGVTVLPLPARLAALGDSEYQSRGRVGRWLDLVVRLAPALPDSWLYCRRLRRVIENLSPDLVHSNGIKTHLLSRLVVPREIPVLWHVHDFFGARPVVARALRWSSGRVRGAIAVSNAVAADLRKVLPGVPVQVIYNAIDVNEFQPGPGDGARLDALAGLPPAAPGTVRVGLVATYARWKGHDVFLQAAARLAAQPPATPVRFYIVGGPVYHTRGSQFTEEELRQQARELGLNGQLGFIGFQEHTADVYRALDVVVHASTRPEPFGLTVAEGMACGKPMIVAQAGGAAELFAAGQEALGVPPGNAKALAAALGELVANPARREGLVTRAREACVARFNADRLGPELIAIYESH